MNKIIKSIFIEELKDALKTKFNISENIDIIFNFYELDPYEVKSITLVERIK